MASMTTRSRICERGLHPSPPDIHIRPLRLEVAVLTKRVPHDRSPCRSRKPARRSADLACAAKADDNSVSAAMLETMADGLDRPWSFAFLPEGVMLVTEKAGALRTIGRDRKRLGADHRPAGDCGRRPGRASRHRAPSQFRADPAGLPVLRGAARGGQERHQRHARQAVGRSSQPRRTSRSSSASSRPPRAAITSARASCSTAREHSSSPRVTATAFAISFRSRTITSARSSASPRMAAFRPTTRSVEGWLPEIWSIGHRNLQGAPIHPETGQLWTVEHGAKGGDELNIPASGQELWLARCHLWRRIFRRADWRRHHGEGGDRAAGALLGPVDRALRHGVLHR